MCPSILRLSPSARLPPPFDPFLRLTRSTLLFLFAFAPRSPGSHRARSFSSRVHRFLRRPSRSPFLPFRASPRVPRSPCASLASEQLRNGTVPFPCRPRSPQPADTLDLSKTRRRRRAALIRSHDRRGHERRKARFTPWKAAAYAIHPLFKSSGYTEPLRGRQCRETYTGPGEMKSFRGAPRPTRNYYSARQA